MIRRSHAVPTYSEDPHVPSPPLSVVSVRVLMGYSQVNNVVLLVDGLDACLQVFQVGVRYTAAGKIPAKVHPRGGGAT